MIDNHLTSIKYKGGFSAGISADRTWNWFGLGFDLDHSKVQVKNLYEVNNTYYVDSVTLLDTYSLKEKNINRFFIGVGPSVKLNLYNKVILFESALRVGVSTFKGGGVELRETTSDKNLVLHYHAGYDQNYGIAAKARVHISYFPRNRSMGISWELIITGCSM